MKRKALLCSALLILSVCAAAQSTKRPMTFMDVMEMRQSQTAVLSPDSTKVLLTVNAVEWKSGRAYSDIYLAPTSGEGMKQMTFTPDKNETAPRWAPDSKSFAFLSDRDSAAAANERERHNQIFLMQPDGGEAKRITSDKDGVERFDFSRDGKWIVFTAGKTGERQLFLYSTESGAISHLTRHDTGVLEWEWASDGKRILFTSPNQVDKLERARIEKKFDVRISNQPAAPKHLWTIEVATKAEKRLTDGDKFSVAQFVISSDGKKVAFRGASPDRYATGEEAEVFILDLVGGEPKRITDNRVGEGRMAFSPDSQWLAFMGPNEFTYMRDEQIYAVPVAGGSPRPLIENFGGDVNGFFWSKDGKAVFFVAGVGVNQQLFSVPASGGPAKQLTSVTGTVSPLRGEELSPDTPSDLLVFTVNSPSAPADLYVARLGDIESGSSGPDRWKRITNINPQTQRFELGQYETVKWKSSDGTAVEGILVKPVGYQDGKRYPLIVQIHGGPASAYMNNFSGNYGAYVHVYAANGYAVFQPNYRGSTNYGEKFKMEIAGDYFRQGYDDIITGVDYLIQRGIADPDKLGMMGWSAGGHWSNWTLTHTDRFKAISSGAGAANWVSMYAQTDQQPPREFYFKGKPYDNLDHYMDVSPIKYIKNAKTPTLIHVGEADQRVPMPQSLELHMALKKLGVPTELIVYPGMPHGLTNPRYQMIKMVSEFGWFEKWIKGKSTWLDWKPLLDTLKDDEAKAPEKP